MFPIILVQANINQINKIFKKHLIYSLFGVYIPFFSKIHNIEFIPDSVDGDGYGIVKFKTISYKKCKFIIKNNSPYNFSIESFGDVAYTVSDITIYPEIFFFLKKIGLEAQFKFNNGDNI